MSKLFLLKNNKLNKNILYKNNNLTETKTKTKTKTETKNSLIYPSLKVNMNYILKLPDKLDKIKQLLGPIYYINMKSRKDRKKTMEHNFKRLNLDFTRFVAFTPNENNYTDFYHEYSNLDFSMFYNYKNCQWKKGTIGCFMSHYLILKELEQIQNPKKYYLILEDDCIPSLNHILASLEFAEKFEDLDILRLNSFNNIIKEISEFGWKINKNHVYFNNKDKESIKIDGGTHYVLIKHNKIKKILDFMESGIIFFIDGMYNTIKLNSYWLNFSYNIILPSVSSIKNIDNYHGLFLIKNRKLKKNIINNTVLPNNIANIEVKTDNIFIKNEISFKPRNNFNKNKISFKTRNNAIKNQILLMNKKNKIPNPFNTVTNVTNVTNDNPVIKNTSPLNRIIKNNISLKTRNNSNKKLILLRNINNTIKNQILLKTL